MWVKGVWASETERLHFDTDHAILIVPEGPDDHRLFFVGTREQQERMTAIMLAFIAENGLAEAAVRILDNNPGPGDFRGKR